MTLIIHFYYFFNYFFSPLALKYAMDLLPDRGRPVILRSKQLSRIFCKTHLRRYQGCCAGLVVVPTSFSSGGTSRLQVSLQQCSVAGSLFKKKKVFHNFNVNGKK